MFFKALLPLLALVAASAVVAAPAADAEADKDGAARVFTATRMYQTLTDVSPFIVTRTTTFVWTASGTTTVAEPTGPGM
ncbi:hypothetical protein R3P38DRAFT_2906277 [Favolaschia claudopus]|uniref:Uncharacterized protein n=1 Tax=Favolaschia claudopus TaxID=2862362 RepID=A0AAW0CJX7_9AGAR